MKGRIQFKDKNNVTLFIFKEKEQSLSMLSLGLPVPIRWKLVLGASHGQAQHPLGLDFSHHCKGTHIFHSDHPFSSLVPTFKAPKGESFELFDIFDVKVERWRGTGDCCVAQEQPMTFQLMWQHQLLYYFPPWNDLFYTANCFMILIFQKPCEWVLFF